MKIGRKSEDAIAVEPNRAPVPVSLIENEFRITVGERKDSERLAHK